MITTTRDRYLKTAVQGREYRNGFSEMLGLSVDSLRLTRATMVNPGLFEKCLYWCRPQDGAEGFDVTSIQINHNLICKPHRDLANSGKSAIISLGSYTGGELLHWPEDMGGDIELLMQSVSPVMVDVSVIRYFDGRCLHATKAFWGTRWTLVFFHMRGAGNTPVQLQRRLVQMGASSKSWQVQSF